MTPFPWTDEQIETLRAEWLNGSSASVIGELLGCGRNAAIGKVFRLKIQRRPGLIIVGLKGPIVQNRPWKSRTKAAVRQAPKPKMERTTIKAPQPVAPAVVITLDHARPWQDRASRQCAYLLDDGRSCCAAVDGRASYCAGHRALVYRPAAKLSVEKMARKYG